MGKKIFVSYKYGDSNVQSLNGNWGTTARHYVDEIQRLIGSEHINKGENDNESMASLADSTIQSKLGDKIYDSSITIVVISPNMKNVGVAECDQWIPWEISYSLREQSRQGRTSKTNAVLAVVLPDKIGSYGYFLSEQTCSTIWCGKRCNFTQHNTDRLFDILSKNMFNRKIPKRYECPENATIDKPHAGGHSYIHCVRWSDFIQAHNHHIGIAENLKENICDYNIVKNLK